MNRQYHARQQGKSLMNQIYKDTMNDMLKLSFEIGTVVSYKGRLYRVDGLKLDPSFRTLQTMSGKRGPTVHISYLEDYGEIQIEKCFTVKQLKEKYPEYCI
jgi:hypothetical protein